MDHSETDIAELVSNNVPRTKSVKELSTIIRFLFENPRNIGIKFSKLGSPQKYKTGHHTDITVLLHLYENIDKLKLNDTVSQSLKFSLESL